MNRVILVPEALAKGCIFQLSFKNPVRSHQLSEIVCPDDYSSFNFLQPIINLYLTFIPTFMDSTCFSIGKAYFMCLSFLCDHSLRFFLSAKPVFCFSFFYATAASAFLYPQSPFSLFLSFLCDHRLHFSLSGPSPPFFLVIMLLWSELRSQLVTPNVVRHRCLNRYITLPQLETIYYNTGTSINYVASRPVLHVANPLSQASDPVLHCLFINVTKYFQ